MTDIEAIARLRDVVLDDRYSSEAVGILLRNMWPSLGLGDLAAQKDAGPVAWRWRGEDHNRWYLEDTPPNATDDEIEVHPLFLHPSPATWQPIETAPRDGEPILVFRPDSFASGFSSESGIDVVWWDEGVWQTVGDTIMFDLPTHWMPLPNAPVAEGKSHD